ncbi:uncharacterized protein LOC107365254 [Tetranychus urticae]|uniref:uncharacterized protein LOC107365254 n=1 Tax=Tetranychus urticae TaxID=32264 RepID=UPI00077B9C73|nr:uncharacterized protein LOC107365254 [Tetranychus urticae]
MISGCFGNTFLIIVQIFFGLLSALLGFISFFYYLLNHEDYNASIWSLFLGVNAISLIHLHVLFLKAQIDVWYDKYTFRSLIKFSFVLSIAAIIALPIYIYLSVKHHEELTLRGYHVDAIFAALSLFWSVNLFCSSRLYSKYVQLTNPALIASIESLETPYTFYVDTF